MNADKEAIREPVQHSQSFAILGLPGSGGAAAAENLRSSAFICG
jgi:hypothetical protein